MSEKRRIVVTSALPYANGDIHLGHLVEYIQTDFWVRFQKMRGNACVYICADDTHGTPIMIRAAKEGIAPEDLIARSHATHLKDFTDFEVAFDNYYSTNSPENKALSEQFFAAMEKSGGVTKRTTPQLYCEHCKMFLPDRFVKGVCPKCGAEGQYGDSCDKCGSTYAAEELGNPVCTTCGGTPVVKDSEHLYFELEPQHDYLQQWIPGHTTSDVSNKLLEWFSEPLRGWCISRAAPYFGFQIPGYPDKYFYVWVDAPIGYLASLQNWCDKNGQKFADWWQNPKAERYHFIGKDIIRFHCLFWPGMLHTAGFEQPNKIFVHGFLTVNGEKMSKSKGTFVNARTYLDHLPASALRYYYACKLGGTTDDMDLNLQDFVQRVNGDMVGKITNLASRGAQMLNKNLEGRMGALDAEGQELVALARSRAEVIAQHYEDRRFSQVPVEVAKIADAANEYFDRREPWKTVKLPDGAETTRTTLTTILNVFRILAIYLKPILPAYAEKVAALFGEASYGWDDIAKTVESTTIGKYEYLATRIDAKQVEAMIEKAKVKPADSGEVAHESRASKNKDKAAKPAEAAAAVAAPALKPEVAFADFEKLDLRIGKVVACEIVPKSAKLLKFTLDCGVLGTRTIFSGIRGAYPDPAALIGKEVLFIANLAPRKMSVGVSEGMILYAGEPGKSGGVLAPLAEAGAGTPAT
ncbi:MAG: methionine--tRNA ligase [Kiritimatiellae bacterium]|nr:methionine--tRNA ligase [Kiritimatiellia bacterium]